MKNQKINWKMACLWLFGVVGAVLLFLETEVCNYNTKLLQMDAKNILMNVAILFAVLVAVYVILGRWSVSVALVGIVISVLSIVNLYSIQFRSTPISARDLFNARSAINVLSSYEINFDIRLLVVLAVGSVLGILVYICWRLEKGGCPGWKYRVVRLLGGVLFVGAFFWFGCFSPNAVKPANISTLRYEEGYQVYGFMQVSVEVFQKAAYKITKPENYRLEAVEELAEGIVSESESETDILPDIILILNESWYDLSQISTFTTDMEVMPYMNRMENTIRGYAVEPNIASGTNLSEYEVLTGNSLQLMQGITPFNSLNLEGATSVVSCLEEQGYSTAAFHSETRSTYNRIIAYPAMGFDEYYFIDDFDEWEYWEQRTEYVTDESNFKNLMKIYKGMDEEAPKFIYDLTTQNHGDYLWNNYKKSTVHVNEDLGDEWLEYKVNEYLSCVNLTDQAFWNLTQKFGDAERPIIICMVGDHAPAFVESVADQDLSAEEMEMRLRSTPYIIWANFDLSDADLPEYLGMPYIPSVLLQLAGAELTYYYDYMVNELMPQVPVLTAYTYYKAQDGNFYCYDEKNSYRDALDTYFYMEYNTVKGGTECVESLFHLHE